jgi:hypothetical protein
VLGLGRILYLESYLYLKPTLKVGDILSTYTYHYFKHIGSLDASDPRVTIFKKNGFEYNRNIGSLVDLEPTIISYKNSLITYFEKSKYMFPKFSNTHNLVKNIAIAFAYKIDGISPALIAGNDTNFASFEVNFNTFYIFPNALEHYNFFMLLSRELYPNCNSSIGYEKENFEVITNMDAALAVFEDYFQGKSNLSIPIVRYFIEILYSRLKRAKAENEKANTENEKAKTESKDYDALNIYSYFILIKLISEESLPKEAKNSIDTDLKELQNSMIIYKYKSQPDSIFNFVNDQDSEFNHLFYYQYFYALLQLKAACYENDKFDGLLKKFRTILNSNQEQSIVYEELIKYFKLDNSTSYK